MRPRGLGASKSATQSRRHDSCAVRAHGQGERHADEVSVSSVSSEKHIQHFLGSSTGGGGSLGCSWSVAFDSSSEGNVSDSDILWKLSEVVVRDDRVKDSSRDTETSSNDISREDLRCCELDGCGGREAMGLLIK